MPSKKLAGARRVGKRWQSQIWIDGGMKHLGMFNTAEEAHEAYLDACEELWVRRLPSSVRYSGYGMYTRLSFGVNDEDRWTFGSCNLDNAVCSIKPFSVWRGYYYV